jgi:hypothetical protein
VTDNIKLKQSFFKKWDDCPPESGDKVVLIDEGGCHHLGGTAKIHLCGSRPVLYTNVSGAL